MMKKNKNEKRLGFKGVFNVRTLQFGSYALIVSIIAIALLVGLNALLGIDRIRTALRVDITANKLFSVSEEAVNVLQELDKEVELIVLMEEKDFSSAMLKEIFSQYRLKSNGMVSTRFVDLDKDPQFVRRELDPDSITGIKKGDLVVKSGSKVRLINQRDLQDTRYDYQTGQSYSAGLIIDQTFASAIMSVTSEETPVVYFLTGHGELSLATELSTLKGTLEINNYDAQTLTLTAAVPEDASVIVMANPKTDLLGEETAILSDWLRNSGGDLIVFADANPDAAEMPNLLSILEHFNLKLNNDLVMEGNQSNYLEQANFVIPRVTANEITTQLDPNSVMLLLPNSRTVEILNNPKDWMTSFPIFQTSAQAARLDAASGYQEPILGSFMMGAATVSEGGPAVSKIVVLGNATFVSNAGMASTTDNGKRYLLTMVNWMQDKTTEVFIPAKSNTQPMLTMNQSNVFVVFLGLTVILPILIIGSGVFVWMRRKHL